MTKFFKRKKIENTLIKKSKFTWKLKAASVAVVLLFLSLGIYSIVKTINAFFDENYLQFNRVIEIVLKRPVEIRKRELKTIQVFLDYPDEIDTPLEKYICEKFGAYECKPALAIALAESGLKENAYNVNSNQTIDSGIFQVNEVHWGKPGCSPKELFDAKSNVDCAYTIWQASGWSPWVSYKSGSYIKHLD